MKYYLFSLFLLSSFKGYSQNYNELKARELIEFYFDKLNPEGKVILDESTYGSIFHGNTSKVQVYDSLKQYFSKAVIDSVDEKSTLYSKTFKWFRNIPHTVVLPSDSVESLFNHCTQRIVRKIKSRCFFHKDKEIVIKEADFSNVYVKTTPPIFVNDYCLISISRVTGSSTGSQCLILYKYTSPGCWQIVKSVYCMLL